jgi:hypothetical protein
MDGEAFPVGSATALHSEVSGGGSRCGSQIRESSAPILLLTHRQDQMTCTTPRVPPINSTVLLFLQETMVSNENECKC